MHIEKIRIRADISGNRKKVWDYYTKPSHIINWNYASDDWCCPTAENELYPGGRYKVRMEARDGSFGFDFEATYTELKKGEYLVYQLDDGRIVEVEFNDLENMTEVNITFDPENQNPFEVQRDGWQAILNNFKKYVEVN
jgi:uncharacterized protein YndB with AHSA1/START domain